MEKNLQKMNSGNSVIKQNIWDDIILLAVILDINFEVKEKWRKRKSFVVTWKNILRKNLDTDEIHNSE